jgi:hypothetical protein
MTSTAQRRYTEADDEYIRNHYPNTPSWEVAKAMGRTRGSVQTRARVIGVNYTGKRVYQNGNNPIEYEHDREPTQLPEPTHHRPGTAEKVRVLAYRAKHGLIMWHEDDEKILGNVEASATTKVRNLNSY